MSKRKSSTTETQRFSGPELSELLDRIAREHGPDAAIAAVNKIRSGGVAGFFCKEEFEVVVKNAPTPDAAGPKQQKPKVAALTAAAPSEPTSELPAQDAPPLSQVPTQIHADSAVPSEPVVVHTADPLQILLDAAERRVAEREGAPGADPSAVIDGEPEVFGGPKPNQTYWTDTRFRALVDRRVDEVASEEASFADRRIGRAEPRAAVHLSAEHPNLQPIVPAPNLGATALSIPVMTANAAATGVAVMNTAIGPLPEFWVRLQQTQHELASIMPMASPSVATIGPLSLTTPIVRRLRNRPGLESAEVIVLTDRAEIVAEPSWELVRSGNQLLERVREMANRPMMVLIDVPVELPNWVAPLENRLRMAGVGLFRYAVPGSPNVERLDQYRQSSDVPYVLDLVSRVEPDQLVDFVARRHPVASVAGADLNAELLMAMREQAGVDR